jgi:hypothetical protein
MTEREEIIEQMAKLSARKSRLARASLLVEKIDPALADDLDEEWNIASDQIGVLQFQLHHIDTASFRVMRWDGRLL